MAVIDTRFLAPSLLIIGERHHEMCLPLSSLRSWIGSCQIFASCRSEAELSVWKQRSIRASSDFSTTIIPLKKGAPCHVLRRQQVKCLQQWQLTMHEHSVWKLLKKSHFTTLRAKRVTFVYKFILMIFGVQINDWTTSLCPLLQVLIIGVHSDLYFISGIQINDQILDNIFVSFNGSFDKCSSSSLISCIQINYAEMRVLNNHQSSLRSQCCKNETFWKSFQTL